MILSTIEEYHQEKIANQERQSNENSISISIPLEQVLTINPNRRIKTLIG